MWWFLFSIHYLIFTKMMIKVRLSILKKYQSPPIRKTTCLTTNFIERSLHYRLYDTYFLFIHGGKSRFSSIQIFFILKKRNFTEQLSGAFTEINLLLFCLIFSLVQTSLNIILDSNLCFGWSFFCSKCYFYLKTQFEICQSGNTPSKAQCLSCNVKPS